MSFECYKCGKCCKDGFLRKGIVIIYPCEVDKISNGLGCSKEDFLETYCVKEYIKVYKEKYPVYRLKNKKRQCIFLENNLCLIHPFKPIQCKKAPFNYFANKGIWKHMPCIDKNDINEIDSSQEDEELVINLMNGY